MEWAGIAAPLLWLGFVCWLPCCDSSPDWLSELSWRLCCAGVAGGSADEAILPARRLVPGLACSSWDHILLMIEDLPAPDGPATTEILPDSSSRMAPSPVPVAALTGKA